MPIFVEKPLIQTAPIKVTGDNKVTFAPSTNIHQSKLDTDRNILDRKKLTHTFSDNNESNYFRA